ncbi:MAG: filamentous hemagglutinin family protein [Desulfatiglandaceae bacterium]
MNSHHGKYRMALAIFLIAQLMLPPALLAKQPRIPGFYGSGSNLPKVPSNSLPEIKPDGLVQGVAGLSRPQNNQLIVHQNEPKAVIDWKSFNIGKEAWTHFDQKGKTDWAALNRIYDQNPSRIFGKLTADGKVFLINQNGILFGPDSQINVHSLAAASLDIAQQDFLANNLHFTGDDARGVVSNHGDIQAGAGGFVYLTAPDVENAGSIDAPLGQVALAAATDVHMLLLDPAYETQDRILPHAYVTPGEKGTAVNHESGRISADGGVAGLYGRNVNQNGHIRSITAISNGGRIELHASDKVYTGPKSVTESPVSDDPEEVHQSFELTGGTIDMAGLDQPNEVRIGDRNVIKNKRTVTHTIEHCGEAAAASGTITMGARDKIYLDRGSRLDVSGEWVSRRAAEATISAQLNSVELKNDFVQKDGVLFGATVEILPEEGSSIGDLSAHLNGEFATAREMATDGGDIVLNAVEGEIIVMGEGDGKAPATLDFSGGGTTVLPGHYSSTKLVSGNHIYDISNAPTYLKYDTVINLQEKVYERYGIKEAYCGLYTGGTNPLLSYRDGFIRGDDAGTLTMAARGIALNGRLDGSATRGYYQTITMLPEVMYGPYAVQMAAGVRAPRGGELVIGPNYVTMEWVLIQYGADEVVIARDVPALPTDFNVDTALMDGAAAYRSEYQDAGGRTLYRSILPAERLNSAGLSDLRIEATTKIMVEKDAVLVLKPGGLRINSTPGAYEPSVYKDTVTAKLALKARAMDLQGTINIPGGDVAISIEDTITSPTSPEADRRVVMNERFFMADGAVISAAGERIDNSLAGELGNIRHGYIDGGNISVGASTPGGAEVILKTGAIMDVSAGYEIDTDATITAGSAGSITLRGSTLVVDADLRGHSLDYEAGGRITLHADKITVKPKRERLPSKFGVDDDLNTFQDGSFADMKTEMVFQDDQLSESGFAHISLYSRHDLTLSDGVTLMPSCVKTASPTPGSVSAKSIDVISPAVNRVLVENASGRMFMDNDGYIAVPLDYLGETSITGRSGVTIEEGDSIDYTNGTESVVMVPTASIEVAPEGSIELSGLVAEIGGTFKAPSGNVTVEATGYDRSVALHETSIIDVSAYNRKVPGSTIPYVGSHYDSLNGGSVKIVAENYGNILMKPGSIIDLSGSEPVAGIFYGSDNTIYTDKVAADAGSLSLIYYNNLVLDGHINGHAYHPQAHAAALSITRTNWEEGIIVDQSMADLLKAGGFDTLALCSLKELSFSGDMDVELHRSLTLDAPQIRGIDNASVTFKANAINLTNKWDKYETYIESQLYDLALVGDHAPLSAAEEPSLLSFSATFIDVTGSMAVSGFNRVMLDAGADISLASEQYYDNNIQHVIWTGKLRTPGDLTLKASRIYPTTYSDFTLASDAGRITTERGRKPADGPIVSAGGSLTLAAAEIDHHGYLAAPLGRIHFRRSLQNLDSADADTVFLAEGSVTSIAADSNVQYGYIEDFEWLKKLTPSTWTETGELRINPVEYIDALPERSIDINSDTMVMQSGAMIDTSAGGSIYASNFQPGINGLENALAAENTYVIVPGIHKAGAAIYVGQGAYGLPAGTYPLLDSSFAFMDNAFVVHYLGSANRAGIPSVTDEGYAVLVGRDALSGTGFASKSPNLYSIRRAVDVINQGDYMVQALAAEKGGNLNILSNTMVMDGSLHTDRGGLLTISGTRSAVVKSTSTLGTGYNFNDIADLIVSYQNTAQVVDTTISDSNLGELRIGTLAKTETVTIAEEAHLEIPVIQLAGSNLIRLEENSSITVSGQGEGHVIINTPDGRFEMGSGSTVNASRRIDINAQSAQFSSEMSSNGQGTLAITTANIFVTNDEHTDQSSAGLYLPSTLKGFAGFKDVAFKAEAGLTFLGETLLGVTGTLTLDTPVLNGASLDSENYTTQISAQNIHMLNSGDAGTDTAAALNGELSLEAAEDIIIGHGNIILEGYDEVLFKAGRDIKLIGQGSMTTSGDTTILAPRLTTGYYETVDENHQTIFEAANFRLQAGNEAKGYRDILIHKPDDDYSRATDGAGGIIEIKGATIGVKDGLIDEVSFNGGWIDVSGGWVTLTATDAPASGNAVDLSGNALIDVSGNDYAPGGRVMLTSKTGSIGIGADAAIDVSAGGQGDAGTLSLSAAQAGVTIDGRLSALSGSGGAGGRFLTDIGGMESTAMTALWQSLGANGFDEQIHVRMRTGNINLGAPEIIKAHQVNLTADRGDISISGTINAAGDAYRPDGGMVAINAGNSLTLGGTILANDCAGCSDGAGGQVRLNAVDNQLGFSTGSQINVSSNTGAGGIVHFRGAQIDSNPDDGTIIYDDVNMELSGEVIGASKVIVEGVRRYMYDTDEFSITSNLFENTYHADADAFLNYAGNVSTRSINTGLTLTGGQARASKIIPGIEIRNTGDITVTDEWDLTELGYSALAGNITLRAAGNINLNNSLVDHPSVDDRFYDDDGNYIYDDYARETLTDTNLPAQLSASWSFNLVAGSDLSSADLMATISDVDSSVGSLNINHDQVIYTENNTIRFASKRDTILYGYSRVYDPWNDFWPEDNPAPRFMVNDTMTYNIGTFFGDIQGDCGQDLIIMNNGAIQSALGDITINVQRDLHIELNDGSGGAIRTTGIGPLDGWGADYRYDEVHDGGDIRLDVYGQLRMGNVALADIDAGADQIDRIPFYMAKTTYGQAAPTPHLKYWDNIHLNVDENQAYTYVWSADFGESFYKNYEFTNTPTAGIATMAGGSVTVNAGERLSGQVGTFKTGDLSIFTNGDISGYLQVANGEGHITAGGNITSPHRNETAGNYAYATSLAMSDAQVTVFAGGEIDFGTVFNPRFPQTYAEYVTEQNQRRWLDYDYGEMPSSVSMMASRGNLGFSGEFWYGEGNYADDEAYTVLPPTASLTAGADILLGRSIILAPSPYGSLNVHAGGNIVGYIDSSSNVRRSTLRMSDLDPDAVYRRNEGGDPYDLLWLDETSSDAHAGVEVLHKRDRLPISITATGDIREIKIISAKETVVNAGGNIQGLYYFGQNVHSDDKTIIQAGGDIVLDSVIDRTGKTGLINAGGGLFLVQSGGSMDLGTTEGIQAVGNSYYSELGEDNSTLAVMAGWCQVEDIIDREEGMAAFFDGIRAYGEAYSVLLAKGDLAGAAEILAQANEEWIAPLNAASSSPKVTGNIEMINSSIHTSAENEDIYIFVKEDFNVGSTVIAKPGVAQKETGVFTSQGGAINIFANGDINVNESRLMTFRGGNITIWSDQGDINAGRGSKTAINVGSPQTEAIYDDQGNLVGYRIQWEPPSVGSGIRTLTYDPDGFQGPLEAPPAGDAYIFAPEGVIDAGEAGIAARNVILGATEVLNAQNISFALGSVGVPETGPTANLGALAGAGSVSEASQIAEESAAVQSAQERMDAYTKALAESLVPKWIAVEVLGFDEPDQGVRDD